jgi:streptomycin 6-kinase
LSFCAFSRVRRAGGRDIVERVDPSLAALDATRSRLVARFGPDVVAWWDRVPSILETLASRWELSIGDAVGRGNTSLVMRCRRADGRAAILKLSPEPALVEAEVGALRCWRRSRHVPALWAWDLPSSALLLEALPDEAPLSESSSRVSLDEVAALIAALHEVPMPTDTPGVVPLLERVDFIFALWSRRRRADDRESPVAPGRLERGHELARTLARGGGPPVLLHGDLHPGNVLNGGAGRGLVAIDPRPCIGDGAFDAADWVFWTAEAPADWEHTSRKLATALGYEPERLWAWCRAFAAGLASARAARSATDEEVATLLAIAP